MCVLEFPKTVNSEMLSAQPCFNRTALYFLRGSLHKDLQGGLHIPLVPIESAPIYHHQLSLNHYMHSTSLILISSILL